MKVPDWIQQAGHFGMSAGGAAILGLPLAWLGLPSFVATTGAWIGGMVPWAIRELWLQWPISPQSDMRWDSLWYFVGGSIAAVVSGALAEWVW